MLFKIYIFRNQIHIQIQHQLEIDTYSVLVPMLSQSLLIVVFLSRAIKIINKLRHKT